MSENDFGISNEDIKIFTNEETDDPIEVQDQNEDTQNDKISEVGSIDQEPEQSFVDPHEENKKIDLLEFLDNCNHNTHRFDMSTDLYVLETEVAKIKRKEALNTQVYYSRHLLFFSIFSMEYISGSLSEDKFGLDGWSDFVKQEASDEKFDEVLRELCQKYASSFGNYGPEIRLCYLLVMSAASYSISNRYKKFEKKEEEIAVKDSIDVYDQYLEELKTPKKKRGRKPKNPK